MTPTRTTIPRKYVKQSMGLQELGSMRFCGDKERIKEWLDAYRDGDIACEHDCRITIADVIDNAEMLFGDKPVCFICGEEYKKTGWEYGMMCVNQLCGYLGSDDESWSVWEWQYCSKEILEMCQQNKSINEISEYIILNIKEA